MSAAAASRKRPVAVPAGEPVTPLGAQPPPRGVKWISADEARKRMAVCRGRQFSIEAIYHRCRAEWQWSGLARKVDGERWEVREDAAPELAPDAAAWIAKLDLGKLPRKQRRILYWKRDLVESERLVRLEAQRQRSSEDPAVEEWLKGLRPGDSLYPPKCWRRGVPSVRRLRDWRRACEQPGGLDNLIPDRFKSDGGDIQAGDDDFMRLLLDYYLDDKAPSKEQAYRWTCLAAKREGWKVHSLSSAKRRIKRIPPAVVARKRGGEKLYVDDFEPHNLRDYTSIETNDWWWSDHHQFDVMVSHENKLLRPWVTGFQDVRSRRWVGWQISAVAPNWHSILRALQHAERNTGCVPGGVYIDNGKDYDAQALTGRTKSQRHQDRRLSPEEEEARKWLRWGVYSTLSIKVHHAAPYRGQSKGIERTFRTIEEQFCKSFPTYCGSSPAKRPPSLPDKLRRGLAPTLEDFAAEFAEWIEVYNNQAHSGQGMNGQTPAQVYTRCLVRPRIVPDNIKDIAFHEPTVPLKVGQYGIRWQGEYYGARDPAVTERIGQLVRLRVPLDDVRQVSVWDLEDRFICRAQMNVRESFAISREDQREAKKRRQQHRKATSDYHKQRPRMVANLTELAREAAADRIAKQRRQKPAAGSMVPVAVGLSAEASKIALSAAAEANSPRVTHEELSRAMRRASNEADAQRAAELAEHRRVDDLMRRVLDREDDPTGDSQPDDPRGAMPILADLYRLQCDAHFDLEEPAEEARDPMESLRRTYSSKKGPT